MLNQTASFPWRGYALAVVTAFVLGSLPTLAAWWAEDEQHRFNGVLHFSEDMDSYAAFCGQAARGAWSFHNPAVLEDHPAAYFNPIWVAGGKLMALFGLSFSGLFWLLRFLGLLVLAVGFIALFSTLLTKDEHTGPRLPWMLFLFLTAQGFGFLGSNPFSVDGAGGWLTDRPFPDRYTELFPFFQTTFVPHAALATGLGFLAVACFLNAAKKGHGFLVSGLLLLLLALIRPYDAVIYLSALLLGVWFCRPKKVFYFHRGNETLTYLLRVALTFAPALAALAYIGWLTQASIGFSIWSQTNRYPPPDLLLLIGSLGLSLPLGLWGLRLLWQRKGEFSTGMAGLLTFMLLGTLGLMYADTLFGWLARLFDPRNQLLPFAWRFCAALGSLWLLVALLGLYRSTESLMPGIRRGVYAAVFVLFGLGTAVILWDKITQAQALSPYDFQPPQWQETRTNLRPLLQDSTVLWTHGAYSQKLAGLSGRVVIGHKDLTPDFQTRMADYRRYCALRHEEEKARILARYGVTDILIGPLDERSGCHVGPGWEPVYRNDLFTLYRQTRQP